MTTFKTALLAASALTMLSGAAMAQSNEATNIQTGNGNMTTIGQQSGGLGHKATSDTTGDSNRVGISQVGSGTNAGVAAVDIDGDGAGGNNNDVSVTQRNFASGNRVAQKATINIQGDFNDVDTTQNYGDDVSNVLKIDLRGNASQQSSGNDVDVFQTNNGNTATVDAWGDQNRLSITQRGSDVASIYVDGSLAGGGDEGSNNYVAIDQEFRPDDGYRAGSNRATVRVNGDFNNGSQGGGFGTLGLQAGLVKQHGEANVVNITLGTLNGIDSDGNTFGTDQDGLRNIINGTILGDGNVAGVRQNGQDNNVRFTQTGNNNSLSADQDGSFNVLTSTQTGSFNVATATQTGMGNIARNTQIGNGNTATITQGSAGMAR